ncbi:hypothetical protein [Salipiger bermudensis]|uniref:hypothetical protein n=1 Tax=Salipiger bermudensis TaxID=344736 RepID=UPI001CD4DEB3|nr:hypothetical protein [Salipiger bermudensis]MCA0961073.1 hypothetical protein [Salipiger bermudensis]
MWLEVRDAASPRFSDADMPWIEDNPNGAEINGAQDSAQLDGVIAHHRKLIRLRRERDIVAFGETVPFLEDSPIIMAYEHRLGDEWVVVVGNFTGETQELDLPEGVERAGGALSSFRMPGTACRLLCVWPPTRASRRWSADLRERLASWGRLAEVWLSRPRPSFP